MPAQNDQAVVLRLSDFSETSQVATLFTAGSGLLRLIAKGSRRGTKTRFAVGLDLLELGDVSYIPRHGDAQLGTLTEWVQRDAFSRVRRELLRLNAALYAAELVAGLTEESDPHPELFAALVGFLRGLAGEGPAAPLVPQFQADLLRAVGYAPNLEECVSCHRRAPWSGPVYFSAGAGGLLCRDCEVHFVEKRRLRPALLATGSAAGDPPEWFALLDYHITYVAGRKFQTSEAVAAALSRERPRGGAGANAGVGE